MATTKPSTVVKRLPPIIMGGAGFSYQLTTSPESLPIVSILNDAFALGIRAIDTSPYYEPSEALLGAALSSPEVRSKHPRDSYILMTKVGRIAENHFDYSSRWVRSSVTRSLQRFQTTYLDVVFAHDVEFVTPEQALEAVGTLFALSDEGLIHAVGMSGYDINILANVAKLVRQRYGRSIDVIQNWAQLTLQNTELEKRGVRLFKEQGVKAVCNASPLASGLLRAGGVPLGAKGDWHPAPRELRAVVQHAAEAMEQSGESLRSLALRYAIARGMRCRQDDFVVATITGISSSKELEENISTARSILRPNSTVNKSEAPFDVFTELDEEAESRDLVLYDRVRSILGEWVDYDFSTSSHTPSSDSQKTDTGQGSEVVVQTGVSCVQEAAHFERPPARKIESRL